VFPVFPVFPSSPHFPDTELKFSQFDAIAEAVSSEALQPPIEAGRAIALPCAHSLH
jgi:hypothetical protein